MYRGFCERVARESIGNCPKNERTVIVLENYRRTGLQVPHDVGRLNTQRMIPAMVVEID